VVGLLLAWLLDWVLAWLLALLLALLLEHAATPISSVLAANAVPTTRPTRAVMSALHS